VHSYDLQQWWHVVGAFKPLVFIHDTDMVLARDVFWNMLLHSLLLGGTVPVVGWKATAIAMALNTVWLAMLMYLLAGLIYFREFTLTEKKTFLVFACFVIALIASMLVIRINTNNILAADARYIYPAVIIIAAFYAKITELHRNAKRFALYLLGLSLAFSFCLLTPALFFAQYLS